jgi:hypothetical protein
MGRLACAGDDHLEPLIGGGRGELDRLVRCLVSGEHPHVGLDAEGVEGLGCFLHHGPVGARAHDDGDFVTHEGETVTDPNNGDSCF